MRRTAAIRALTGIAFASAIVLACGDGATPEQPPTSTSVLDATTEDAPTCQLQGSGDIPNDPRISLEVVEGILPSSAATSATLGIAPGSWVIAPYLGYEFALTFAGKDSGVTAGWYAWYCSASLADAMPEEMGVELFFHDTPEHAEQTYQYLRADHEVNGYEVFQSEGEETIAAAVSMMTLTVTATDDPARSTVIIIRHGAVTATTQVRHDEDRDVSAGLREFARMLALGIDEFVRSQGP